MQEGAIEFESDEEDLPKALAPARGQRPLPVDREYGEYQAETAPLLPSRSRESRRSYGLNGEQSAVDPESQKSLKRRGWYDSFSNRANRARGNFSGFVKTARNPSSWDRERLWQEVIVTPISCLPAVIVGLLLNILDALSYGKPIRFLNLKGEGGGI